MPHPERRPARALPGIVCCILIATALAGIAQPAQARVKPGFYGLNLAFYEKLSRSNRALLKKSGLRTMRVTLNWSGVQPTQLKTDWSQPDALFGQLAKLGIRPQPLLYSSPYWVNGRTVPVTGEPLDGQKHSTPPVGSPQARADWRAFVQAAVNRYKPGGTFWTGPFAQQHPGVKPEPVKQWQVWNEPNIVRSFDPQPSVAKYASLLKSAHRAIVAADPKARTALAGMPSESELTAAEYLRELYRVRGIKKSFDVVAVHPYGRTVRSVHDAAADVRRVMRRAHDAKTPMWASEISWGSAPKDGHINQGRRGQARLLTRTLKMLAHNRRALNLHEVSWFVLRDPGPQVDTGTCTWCRYSGLLDDHGNPKPSWDAFERLLRPR